MGWGSLTYGTQPYAPLGTGPSLALSVAPILNSQGAVETMKSQFVSSEKLRIVFPPFLKTDDNTFITLGDTITLTVVKPNGSVFTPAPVMVRDINNDFWSAEIDVVDFAVGEWTIKAVSSAVDSLPQYKSVVWGDYVNDISTSKKMLMGRWKIETNQLKIYEEDGTTIFRTYDLKDSLGGATSIRVFERVPV